MNKKLALLLIVLLVNGAVIVTSIQKVESGSFTIANTHPIEGYSNKISYFTGEKAELKIHCPERTHSVEVIRFGQKPVTMGTQAQVTGIRQNYPFSASQTGADWKTTYSFVIPDHWENGMYGAKLETRSGDTSYITFVVKGQEQDLRGDIAVLASTNTWNAYNSWGGYSLYENTLTPSESMRNSSGILSMMRPNPAADPTLSSGHLAGAEIHILSWLERENYPYKLFADQDLHENPEILNPFKILIISTHNEYWTESMYNSLQKFLDRGGSLLYLSGNGIYWKAVLNNNQMEVRKNFQNHLFDGTQGGYWTKQLNRPESALLGVRFQNTEFTVPGPYKVLAAGHWVFQGTGLQDGDLIGETGLTKARGSSGGASGWETDQMDKYSPKNTVLLAQGINTVGKGADMVYYDHSGGGGVFAVGSITFGGSLAVDEDLSRIVKNVLNAKR